MIRTAFSTVACPSWTLSRVLDHASRWGYDAVELRSFVGGTMPGRSGGTGFASEPMLTDGEKIRDLVNHEGITISAFATGIRFDTPVFPPDHRARPPGPARLNRGRSTRRRSRSRSGRPRHPRLPLRRPPRIITPHRHAAHRKPTAQGLRPRHVTKTSASASRTAAHSRRPKTSRPSSDFVNHPLIRVAYDVKTGAEAGDSPQRTSSTRSARSSTPSASATRRARATDRQPSPWVRATFPTSHSFAPQAEHGLDCFAVVNWDAFWIEDLAPCDEVLPEAIERLYGWIGEAMRSRESNAA